MSGSNLLAHALQACQRLLEHVQVGRLATARRAYQHKSMPHDDHLVQLDHLRS